MAHDPTVAILIDRSGKVVAREKTLGEALAEHAAWQQQQTPPEQCLEQPSQPSDLKSKVE